jgi:hypothetical protein
VNVLQKAQAHSAQLQPLLIQQAQNLLGFHVVQVSAVRSKLVQLEIYCLVVVQ